MNAETNICKRHQKCPIYQGILKAEKSTEAYRELFCNADWESCKRYKVAEITGKCPPRIMPNTFLSITEIIEEMKIKGIIE